MDPAGVETLKDDIQAALRGEDRIWVITSNQPPGTFGLEADVLVALEAPRPNRAALMAVSDLVSDRFAAQPVEIGDVLQLDNLQVRRGRFATYTQPVTLQAPPGTVTWLEGVNASGKTTVFEHLAGLVRQGAWRGRRIRGTVEGHLYSNRMPAAPVETVRMAFQNPQRGFVHQTVLEDLGHRRSLCGAEATGLDTARAAVIETGLGSLDRSILEFSFGELKFLQLLLLPDTAEVVLVDEPFLGIAEGAWDLMDRALTGIAESGRIVIASAQPRMPQLVGRRVYTMGTVEEVH